MQKQVKFNSMMGKGCKESKNIEQSYSNDYLKFLFRVLFFFIYAALKLFAGILDSFTLKNDTCFSDGYFHHTIWFFEWCGSKKAECGHQQDGQSAA